MTEVAISKEEEEAEAGAEAVDVAEDTVEDGDTTVNSVPGIGGFYKQQRPMNPVKFFKNWNYRWSCGFDVEDWHTSASCPYPREGADLGNHNNKFDVTLNNDLTPTPLYTANNVNPTTTSNNYYTILDNDNYGILDSGATDIYLKASAPIQTINYNHIPIGVTIPNGKAMVSSATATLPIPQRPKEALTGYIIPGLNKSFIPVTKLCAPGCTQSYLMMKNA
eukprot:CCRYP_000369-RB/>CCRYP_000369-RB protein AED:0.52 eAED:0.42 QI:0/0/0/0.66/0/0/3/0/220